MNSKLRFLFVLNFLFFTLCTLVGKNLVPPSQASANLVASVDSTDSLRISLLTCAPGTEVHRLYGHTALRIENLYQPKEDWVYNFGWFSFDTPNFVGKFILGLTDYSMAKQSTAWFLSSYVQESMLVTAQELNLSPKQKQQVKQAMENIFRQHGFDRKDLALNNNGSVMDTLSTLTPHWTYRYNFLYDNCTTRAVKAITDALSSEGEKLYFPPSQHSEESTSPRQMIHEFTRLSPWIEFGQDFLLGPEMDQSQKSLDVAQQVFLPTYAQRLFDQAKVRAANGELRPLVLKSAPLFPLVPPTQQPVGVFTPTSLGLFFVVLSLLIGGGLWQTYRQQKASASLWAKTALGYDLCLMTLQSLVGILLVVMVCASEHPTVGTNYLLLLFNPIYILLAWVQIFLWRRKKDFVLLHYYNLVVCGLLVLIGLFDLQFIALPLYLFCLAITLRAATSLYLSSFATKQSFSKEA